MSDKPTKASAEKPRGFRDRLGAELLAERRMLETIREVYESYGFDPLETPVIEFADALGKFLPDQDRPNEGVFAFRDDDEEWLSLRYDLTAPLARFVAENVATRSAKSFATKSPAPAATASSRSSTPTLSARRACSPTANSA
jgi:histidyl-tRNA synthetase